MQMSVLFGTKTFKFFKIYVVSNVHTDKAGCPMWIKGEGVNFHNLV